MLRVSHFRWCATTMLCTRQAYCWTDRSVWVRMLQFVKLYRTRRGCLHSARNSPILGYHSGQIYLPHAEIWVVMEDGQLASTEIFYSFSICYVELALESSDKIQNFLGQVDWNFGLGYLGDNTCLVHFSQSRELRSVRQKLFTSFKTCSVLYRTTL